jgi:hypothetical protein
MNSTCLSLVLCVLGQAPTDEAALKEILYPFYAREAAAYGLFRDEAHKEQLRVRKQPVLTWTNAENYMGAVFIWEFGGRPEMIGCIGSHQNRPGRSNFFHELHSLSLRPLEPVAFGGGAQTWKVTKPGVVLAPVEGAPDPADSERLRLAQMRAVAREFRGWMKDGEDVTELRLLPQPIIRYAAAEQGVIDGAIFALVWKGTDPEVLLILEDRKDDSGSHWNFALVRFNFREMWVERSEKEVWRVAVSALSENYITAVVGELTHDEIRKAVPRDVPVDQRR